MIKTTTPRIAPAILAGLGLGLAGSVAAAAQTTFDPALDGLVTEWPADQHAAADAEFLYFHLPVGELRPLFAEGKPIHIRLDLDSNIQTGSAAGTDLALLLTHRDNWQDPRVVATAFDADGTPTELTTEQLEPLTMPNSAAEAFEFRLRRDAHASLLAGGTATGEMVLEGARRIREGRQTRFEDLRLPLAIALPAGQAVQPVDAILPEKVAGSVRLLSHNVLWSSPEENPEPFARLYQALDADIYLIQEWGRGDWSPGYEAELEAWFQTHVDPERHWTAIRSSGWGVAVVTPHPVVSRGPVELMAESLTRWDFPVRFAGAVVLTPEGPFSVGSVHLKAGGSLDTPEDQRRFDEAQAIRAELAELTQDALQIPGDITPITVLGGDFNHNGHPKVPETALLGLDADGSPLTMAFTPVLGTDARYSFGGPAYGHRRAFLDYIGIPDARAAITASFVLDTEILSDASLRAMELQRQDTSAADHLPVVVDLDPHD